MSIRYCLAISFVWAMTGTAVLCCTKSVVRTPEIPGRIPVEISLPSDEAELIDGLVEKQPADISLEACKYWKSQILGIKPEKEKARSFASESIRGWCALAAEDAERAAEEKKKIEEEITKQKALAAAEQHQKNMDRKAQAISAEELKSGTCNERIHIVLQRVLQNVKNVLHSLGRGRYPTFFKLVAHKIIVAPQEGVDLSFSSIVGGEIHLFALSYLDVALDVRDVDGNSLALTSNYESAIYDVPASDSRLFEINSWDEVSIRVRGSGCTLVMAFRKY